MHPQSIASHGVRFGRAAATISVTDMERALQFYVGVLGFSKVFENGSPVGFVILKQGDAELHLSLNKRHQPTTQNVAHVMVSDATALSAHLEACGARIVKGLRDADFGLKCLVFADPDGNRIDVGEERRAPHADGAHAGAVLYARDVARVAAFYVRALGLAVAHEEPAHVVLESPAFQLVVLAIAANTADAAPATPPARRTGAAVKLVFFVPSIDAARAAALEAGGALNGPERQWTFQQHLVCDGHDPEGNVVQVRQPMD